MNGASEPLDDDQREGLRRGAEGAERAWKATDPEWREQAMYLILEQAEKAGTAGMFTSDDIYLDTERLPRVEEPRALGMPFAIASRNGWIEKWLILDMIGEGVLSPEMRERLVGVPFQVVSKNPEQHGQRIQVWRKKR